MNTLYEQYHEQQALILKNNPNKNLPIIIKTAFRTAVAATIYWLFTSWEAAYFMCIYFFNQLNKYTIINHIS